MSKAYGPAAALPDLAGAAVTALFANALRATLTTLGILIGVASVIVMLALGHGARLAVADSFRHLGSDMVQIRVKERIDQGELVPVGQALTYEDGLSLARDLELVERVMMSVSAQAKLRQGQQVMEVVATGTTADALAAMVDGTNDKGAVQPAGWQPGRPLTAGDLLTAGRFYTAAEVLSSADVCVLGQRTIDNLFGGDEPLETAIWVNRRRCLVIGVVAELETVDPALRRQSKLNETLFLPVSTVARTLYDEEPSVEITARIGDEARMAEALEQIGRHLRRRHASDTADDGSPRDDFDLTTRQELLGAQQAAARTFSFLLAGMAGVSLVVGGIGIMNVMLVSVMDRTREIGIRLAVGARRGDIVIQFLLEAMLLGALGGLLGVAAGVLSVPLAAALNGGGVVLVSYSIPLAAGVALLTGVLFGLYPAVRAARLKPIEALRHE